MDSSNDKAVILKMHVMRLDKIILYNAKKEEILIGYFLKCDFKYLISSISLLSSHLSLDRLLEKEGQWTHSWWPNIEIYMVGANIETQNKKSPR